MNKDQDGRTEGSDPGWAGPDFESGPVFDQWPEVKDLGTEPLATDTEEWPPWEEAEMVAFTAEQRAYVDESIARAVAEAAPHGLRERQREWVRARRAEVAALVESGMPPDAQTGFDEETLVGRAALKLSSSRWWAAFLYVVLVLDLLIWAGIVYARLPPGVGVGLVVAAVGLPVGAFLLLSRRTTP